MVRTVKAGSLRVWTGVLWVVMALGLAYGIHQIPKGVFRPSLVAVAGAFPFTLLIIKAVVLAMEFYKEHVHSHKRKPVVHRDINAVISIRFLGVEIRWSYRAKK